LENCLGERSIRNQNAAGRTRITQRDRRESLQVDRLVEGKYEKCDRSLAFPFLPVAEILAFIEQSRTVGQRVAVRLFRQRMRELLHRKS
jgi:hypothetical protein